MTETQTITVPVPSEEKRRSYEYKFRLAADVADGPVMHDFATGREFQATQITIEIESTTEFPEPYISAHSWGVLLTAAGKPMKNSEVAVRYPKLADPLYSPFIEDAKARWNAVEAVKA